jgi:archaellum component FlaC
VAQIAASIMAQAAEFSSPRTVGGRDYGDNMTDAHTRIDSLKDDIREIGYTVLDLQAKAVAHDSKLEQVLATQLAHDARFDAHDARFDAMDARFDGLDSRLDGLDNRLDGLDNRLDGLETVVDRRFQNQDSRFDQVDALLAEVLSRLSERP